MPSTHLSLHYHLIFSTKDRVAFMHKDWRGRLHAYMGGIINDMGGVPEMIDGVEDHIHLPPRWMLHPQPKAWMERKSRPDVS